MNVLDHFSIPYKGLKIGVHTFNFEVDQLFFKSFENAYVHNGKLSAVLSLDKRPDLAIADITLNGTVVVTCDRCLDDLDLPLNESFRLHIKFSKVEEEHEEVIFIDPDSSHVNFGKFIYDSICLSIPMVNYHENLEDCNKEMIQKLNDTQSESKVENIWNVLEGINLKEK